MALPSPSKKTKQTISKGSVKTSSTQSCCMSAFPRCNTFPVSVKQQVVQVVNDGFTQVYIKTNIGPPVLGFQTFDISACGNTEPPETVLIWELKRAECVAQQGPGGSYLENWRWPGPAAVFDNELGLFRFHTANIVMQVSRVPAVYAHGELDGGCPCASDG